MLRLLGDPARTCDGVTRRELLSVGALSLFGGMTLPRFLQAAERSGRKVDGPAKSVILLNLFGGPSHIDMFDLKPDAPSEIRGEFSPISTSVSGLQISEHLPLTAKLMHRATLIRSFSHGYNSHNPYGVLTGFNGGRDVDNYFSKKTDHPSMGSVCQYLGMGPTDVPSYVFMPAPPGYSQALRRSGPYGGYLGSQYDPCFTVCEPTFDREFIQTQNSYNPITPYGEPQLPALDDLPAIDLPRLGRRKTLLQELDREIDRFGHARGFETTDHFQQQAMTILTSDQTRNAFDLSKEPDSVRDRYGRNLYGNCMLLARRLVEAGVLFTCIHTESKGAGHWDSHGRNFHMLRDFHLPTLDHLYSALIRDLDERGLLDSTLVVVMGEMGRTPRVNSVAGRDHWPQCGFSLLIGGGVKEGCVHGASDKHGAYPTEDLVSGGDIVATIYKLLGVDPNLHVPDLRGRPNHVAHGGAPIANVIA